MPQRDSELAIALALGAAWWFLAPRAALANIPPRVTGTGSVVPPWTPAGVPSVAPEAPGLPSDAWALSATARAASDPVRFSYFGGGLYDPAACVRTPTEHASDLATTIRNTFPRVHTIGIVRCGSVANGAENSLHHVGRALDVMLPTLGDPLGEVVANWAVANADPLGVQFVIWNRRNWNGSRPVAQRFGIYPGTNPHRDHVHLEVTT